MREGDGVSFDTIQGVVYTDAAPAKYGDSWAYSTSLSSKSALIDLNSQRVCQYNFGNQFPVTLLFACGPNVNLDSATRPASSSMRRTLNRNMVTEPSRLIVGIAAAQRSVRSCG